MFLTQREIATIRIDYRKLFASPEATRIKVVFSTYLTKTGADPIYGNVEGVVDPIDRVVENVPSVIKYVTARHLSLLEFDFIEVGSIVIYFPEDFNAEEPMPGVESIDDSMYYVLPGDIEAAPDLEHVGDLSRSLRFWLGEHKLGSAVSCKVRRT